MKRTESSNPCDLAHVEIQTAEEAVIAQIKGLKKCKSCLTKARTRLARGGGPIKTLADLVSGLKEVKQEPDDFSPHGVANKVEDYRLKIAHQLQQDFQSELRTAAGDAGLEVTRIGDDLSVGPFGLRIDSAKECASLEYAREEVESKLPLNAAKIIETAQQVAHSLLASPADLAALASDVSEAIKVCLARQDKAITLAKLRGELPQVYHEMIFIRQRGPFATKRTFKDYPLARFVVEIGTLLSSDYNASADSHFRLESAVIENTKNRRKSFFIPRDLRRGFGEGAYFQAIILERAR